MLKTVNFAGTATSRAQVTLVSPRIMRPFTVKRIVVHWPTGTQNLVSISPWIGMDDEAPSTGSPTGQNILWDYGQSGTIRGDGRSTVLLNEVEVPGSGAYLKLVCQNDDWYDHAVDCQIVVEVE